MQPRKWFFYCFFIFLSLAFSKASAQQTNVTIEVLNAQKQPVPFATVTIMALPDTVVSQERLTDTAGIVVFSLTMGKAYSVGITSINYDPLEVRITVEKDNPVYTFTAKASPTSLSTVVVTATRPLMRQEDDKTIVDPENLAASSTNAYEIMEKTPGLFVDQDGNIYLNSMTPATIFINGREQKMSAADVATMLKSLPPNSIASIEIMRTPSARYDASGAGGIVNVVLKKGVRIGLTGSVNAGFNQGRFGNRFVGITLNNNNGKLTTNLNLQYTNRNNYEQIQTDRIFTTDSLLSQNAYTRFPANSFYVGYGLSYQWKQNLDISYDGRLSYNYSKNNSINESFIRSINTGAIRTSNENLVQNNNQSFNINQGVSSKLKLDSLGSEWTNDFSLTYSPTHGNQAFSTFFHQPINREIGGDGDIKNRLYFFSAQTNLQKRFAGKLTFETGLKTTNVNFTNETEYFLESSGDRKKDNFRTRSYRYKENIHAAYLQGSKGFAGFILKMGARLENTNMQGNQRLPGDTSFSLNRTDIFPYVYFSRHLMNIAGYDIRAYLVYRRTINRPAYEYLNPFPRYIDQYLFESGNPSLRPQFTQNYEANISANERPLFAVGINETKDIFNQVIYQADSTNALAYRTWDNIGSNKETYFRAIAAIPPGKRYFFVVGAQYNHNFYNGLYENKPLQFKRGTWSVFTYHTFKITPLTNFTLNGFARFKGQMQFYELNTFGALNMSLSQQFLNKKLVATISANDVFFTNNNEFVLNQGSIHATGFRKGDTRRFGLNLRYNFGFRKKEENTNNIFNIESPDKMN